MQAKDKKAPGKKKREKKKPAITAISPDAVHRSHITKLIITGKGIKLRHAQGLQITNAKIVETKLESDDSIAIKVKVDDGTKNSYIGIKSSEIDISDQLARSVQVLACPVNGMTTIPAGTFVYGSNHGAPSEGPERTIHLPEFACQLYEISNLEYMAFLNYLQEYGDHGKCHPDEGPLKSHIPDGWDNALIRSPYQPVTGVDWFDAYAFSAWRRFRLPTEEEWEKAARGTDGRDFPWGDRPDVLLASTADSGKNLVATWSFPLGRGPYGLFNALGNVWEWTASEGPSENTAVIRGGSYRTAQMESRTYVRNWIDRRSRRDDVGFRCVVDLTAAAWERKKKEFEKAEAKAKKKVASPN